MLLTEKESSELILRVENIIVSNGASHHKLKDLRNVLDKLFKVLCKENRDNEKLTTDKRIKYIFNNFTEHRSLRKEAEGLRTELNDITHDDDFKIKVSEIDVLRCAEDLKNLVLHFSFKKNEIKEIRKAININKEKVLTLEFPVSPKREKRKAPSFMYKEGVPIYLLEVKNSFEWWLWKGKIEYEEEDFKNALQSFTEALKLNPIEANVYTDRAFVYKKLNMPYEALQDFTKVLELNPKDHIAYHRRGNIYYEDFKQYEKAIADYSKEIEFDPIEFPGYLKRGKLFLDLRQYEKAIADLTKAIQCSTTLPEPYLLRGHAYRGINKQSKAKADFAKAKELSDKSH